jgi:hypothetical protein
MSDLESELTANGFSTAIVSEYRSEYEARKAKEKASIEALL